MIIETPKATLIINGGNPLEGCPKSWDEANIWAAKANKDDGTIQWRWDCGFKLDYDGEIVGVSSRFYPPTTHYGATWDGTVTITIMGKDWIKKEFDCNSLDELKEQVEKFIRETSERIEKILRGMI